MFVELDFKRRQIRSIINRVKIGRIKQGGILNEENKQC